MINAGCSVSKTSKKNTRSKKKIPVVPVSKTNRDHCNHLVDKN